MSDTRCEGCNEPAAYSALDMTMRCDACRVTAGRPPRGVKHGPGGRGEVGPCDMDCEKCLMESRKACLDWIRKNPVQATVELLRRQNAEWVRGERDRLIAVASEELERFRALHDGFEPPKTAVAVKHSNGMAAAPARESRGDSSKPSTRPDGFAQSTVDAAKAVMLSSVPKGKR